MFFRIGMIGYAMLRIHVRLSQWYWRARLCAFGSGSRIYSMARIYVPRSVSIGRNVSINDFVHIWGGGGVIIGDNTLIAAHCVITSQTHDVSALKLGKLYRQTAVASGVKIGNNVWIGSGVIILPGVTIGNDSVVAAGAVVTRDVPAGTLVAGMPARPVRRLDVEGQ